MWEYLLCYLGYRSFSSCKSTRLSSQWIEVNKFDMNFNKFKFCLNFLLQINIQWNNYNFNIFRSHRFFDVFEYNALEKHWGCFLCNHPDRAHNFVQVILLNIYVRPNSIMFKKLTSFFMFLRLSGTNSGDRRSTKRKERRKMENIQEMEE